MIRALLGGSFDPVHEGHVAMAKYVLSTGLAAVVHVVPAWLSPHKDQTSATAEHRLAMVRLAFRASPDLVIDTREIDSGCSCYTIDSLAALQHAYPQDTWRLVIGGDNLATFARWYNAGRLQAMTEIVVMGRRGQDLSAAAIAAAGLSADRVRAVPDFDQVVSSTAVRAMLAAGPVSLARLSAGGIPATVAEYILAHRLYLPDQNGEILVPDPD